MADPTPSRKAALDPYEHALPEELRETYRNASEDPDMGKEIRVVRVIITSLLPEIAIASTRKFVFDAIIGLGRLIASQIRALGKSSMREEELQDQAEAMLVQLEQGKDIE